MSRLSNNTILWFYHLYSSIVLFFCYPPFESPLRLSYQTTEDDDGVMRITFTLLENSSVEGDSANPMPQPTLDEANDNMEAAIRKASPSSLSSEERYDVVTPMDLLLAQNISIFVKSSTVSLL